MRSAGVKPTISHTISPPPSFYHISLYPLHKPTRFLPAKAIAGNEWEVFGRGLPTFAFLCPLRLYLFMYLLFRMPVECKFSVILAIILDATPSSSSYSSAGLGEG